MSLVHLMAAGCAAITICGVLAVLIAARAVERFCAAVPNIAGSRPAVTVLRPLCGGEPMLQEALESLCLSTYGDFQIVLGVQESNDPAIAAVQRLRARFPDRDIVLVVDSAGHGRNRKINNLMNMLPHARHDVLVFCDSDLHLAPDYLDVIVAALQVPGTGLVTTVCAGLAVVPGLAARLGASAISHCFVPGALLSRELGREDCLGTTMALRRETLVQAGGLTALCDHLADDNALGRLIRRLGLSIAVARTIPATAVTESTLAALWTHELRWARTIRKLEPMLYALSIIQYPLFWGTLGCALAPGTASALLLAAAWAIRAAVAHRVDRSIQPGRRTDVATLALLPLRDILSAVEVSASFLGVRVHWRGHQMRADTGPAEARPGSFVPPFFPSRTSTAARGPQTP